MEIPLRNKDKVVTDHTSVSPEDYDTVNKSRWYKNLEGYVRNDKLGLLSHFIHGKPREGYVIDHIDHNPLNNTRENLREITYSQNAQNRMKNKKIVSTSKYIGVSFNKDNKRWRVKIQEKHIGYYDDELDAGKSYDKAAYHLFGKDAKTNKLLTQTEIDVAVSSKELKTDGVRSRSTLGTGITRREILSGYKFYVILYGKQIGNYDTLEEAQKISKDFLDAKKKEKLDAIQKLPIERNTTGIAIIPLRNKDKIIVAYALVDDEHWHDLMRVSWSLGVQGYPRGHINGKTYRLHQYLYEKVHGDVPKKHMIDHIGSDETDSATKKLDNRVCNLKAVTASQNAQNRVRRSNTTRKYLGVSMTRMKQFLVCIKYNNKTIRVGTFPTEREAAEAYNTKALELFGTTARLNIFEVDDPEILAPVVEFVPVEVNDDTGVVSG